MTTESLTSNNVANTNSNINKIKHKCTHKICAGLALGVSSKDQMRLVETGFLRFFFVLRSRKTETETAVAVSHGLDHVSVFIGSVRSRSRFFGSFETELSSTIYIL